MKPSIRHHGRRDITRGTLHHRQRSRFFSRNTLFGAAGAALVIAGFFYVLYGDFFHVRAVEVEGLHNASSTRVQTFVEESIRGSAIRAFLGPEHILFWKWANPADLAQSVPKDYSSVSMRVNFWERTVNLIVKERELFGVWCARSGECVNFDSEGIAFSSAPDIYGALVLKIESAADVPPALGERIFSDPAWLGRIVRVRSLLKSAGISAGKIRVLPPEMREWEFVLSSGTVLHFSLEFTPEYVSSAIAELGSRAKLSALSYADFRIPGRLYYR